MRRAAVADLEIISAAALDGVVAFPLDDAVLRRAGASRGGDRPTWHPESVNKTSVYLSPEDATRLAALAQREGTTQAEIIRRAIKQYEPEGSGDRNFALAGSATGSGSSVAALTDEELLNGLGA